MAEHEFAIIPLYSQICGVISEMVKIPAQKPSQQSCSLENFNCSPRSRFAIDLWKLVEVQYPSCTLGRFIWMISNLLNLKTRLWRLKSCQKFFIIWLVCQWWHVEFLDLLVTRNYIIQQLPSSWFSLPKTCFNGWVSCPEDINMPIFSLSYNFTYW